MPISDPKQSEAASEIARAADVSAVMRRHSYGYHFSADDLDEAEAFLGRDGIKEILAGVRYDESDKGLIIYHS